LLSIALAGNPNSGKTSLFNALTGLNQKVGNYPGVTVDKKIGKASLDQHQIAQIIDLPGTYSLYPKGMDEYVAYEVLLNAQADHYPDLIVVLVDASNLKRNLLLCTQILDLDVPTVVALTMADMAAQKGNVIDVEKLSANLGVPVVTINPRAGTGIAQLKSTLLEATKSKSIRPTNIVEYEIPVQEYMQSVKEIVPVHSNYGALHIGFAEEGIHFISSDQRASLKQAYKKSKLSRAREQAKEIMQRYEWIDKVVQEVCLSSLPEVKQSVTQRLDHILLHKVWGNIILLMVLFLMFQVVFTLASIPMDWIDAGFAWAQEQASLALPETWWSDLLINGLLAGIGGVLIFVPQIALLFGIITVLEDTGYMARISFLTDRIMRSVGLNGKSVMPMISGLACAIPAVMAARSIENRKERLITILVTPLMSCSARLPIYIILIALVVPEKEVLHIFSLQGIIMFGTYILGFIAAMLVAKVLDWLIKSKEKSVFMMELPLYRAPRWKNVFITMFEKAKIFVVDAGKVILIISMVLWALASFGPKERGHVIAHYEQLKSQQGELTIEQEEAYASERLAYSYAGYIGKSIEPVIAPLGYDWKIGIALIASFAAREVFVGTIATLYSVADADENSVPLKQKMKAAVRDDGTPVYTLATGASLIVFYAFAMQCMSTFSIVRRELKSWKWPLLQLGYMTVLAYAAAWLTYQIFQ
jgi:ferrous iron transport protein B